jgi:hypothetical protein
MAFSIAATERSPATLPSQQYRESVHDAGLIIIHSNQAKYAAFLKIPCNAKCTFSTTTPKPDRLVKEMRLRGIKSLEEANGFLEEYWPIYNRKFAVGARGDGDLHRSLPKGLKVENILCVKATRALRNDFTVAYNKKLYQIEDPIRAAQVKVHERPDGSIVILAKDRHLRYREILTRPVKERKQPLRTGPKKTTIPPRDHYWRKFKFGKGKYDPGISPGSKP